MTEKHAGGQNTTQKRDVEIDQPCCGAASRAHTTRPDVGTSCLAAASDMLMSPCTGCNRGRSAPATRSRRGTAATAAVAHSATWGKAPRR
eukprot:6157936-Prymnesium_polylepis.2